MSPKTPEQGTDALLPEVLDNEGPAPRRIPRLVLYPACLLFAPLCGPEGTRLGILFQTMPLPRSWYPFAEAAHFVGWFAYLPGYFVTGIAIPLSAVIALFSKNTRRYVPILFAMSAIAICSLPLNWRLRALKNWGMRNAIEKAQPLIEAIESYKTDHGSIPNDLVELVPKYIEVIPYTGMVGYPEFRYTPKQPDSLFRDYEIWISTSTGLLNWDRFVYWPAQQYPQQMYGGSVENIDGWAYVHE